MIDAGLVLIDGMPGSGKSTMAQTVYDECVARDLGARLYLELEPEHPLAIRGRKFTSLHQDGEAEAFAALAERAFQDFAADRLAAGGLTIMEAWLFQDTLCYAHNLSMDRKRLRDLSASLRGALEPLRPVQVFFYQSDVEAAWRRICAERGPEWTAQVMGTEPDFARAAEDWVPSQAFALAEVEAWAVPTLVLRDSFRSWVDATEEALAFLGLGGRI